MPDPNTQAQPGNAHTANWLKDLLLLFILFAIIFGITSMLRPLSFPDIIRYAEIPQQMLKNHEFITPRINGVKYLAEPPFFYWLQSTALQAFGMSSWALRFWPSLMGIIGCLVMYAAGRHLHTRRTGWMSALILGTSAIYFLASQTIGPFTTVSTLFLVSMVSFLCAVHTHNKTRQRWYIWGFWFAAALNCLIIGLSSLIHALVIIVVWMALIRDWRYLKHLFKPSGIFIYLLITLPWIILAQKYNAHYLSYYFNDVILSSLSHTFLQLNFTWQVLFIAFCGFLPWAVFLMTGIWYTGQQSWQPQEKAGLFLLVWAAVLTLYFFFSPLQESLWILNLIIPLSLITGRYLSAVWLNDNIPQLRYSYELLTIIFLMIIGGCFGIGFLDFIPLSANAILFFKFMTVIVLLCAVITLLLIRYGKFRTSFVTLVIVSLICTNLFLFALPHFDKQNIRPLAESIQAQVNKDDVLVSYDTYYSQLPMLFNKPIVVVNWQNLPAYGKQYQNTGSWVVDSDTFWHYANQHEHTYYIFTTKQAFANMPQQQRQQLQIVREFGNNLLLKT